MNTISESFSPSNSVSTVSKHIDIEGGSCQNDEITKIEESSSQVELTCCKDDSVLQVDVGSNEMTKEELSNDWNKHLYKISNFRLLLCKYLELQVDVCSASSPYTYSSV